MIKPENQSLFAVRQDRYPHNHSVAVCFTHLDFFLFFLVSVWSCFCNEWISLTVLLSTSPKWYSLLLDFTCVLLHHHLIYHSFVFHSLSFSTFLWFVQLSSISFDIQMWLPCSVGLKYSAFCDIVLILLWQKRLIHNNIYLCLHRKIRWSGEALN